MENIKKELSVWLKRIGVYFTILATIAVFAIVIWKIPITHSLWTNNAYTQYNTTQLNEMGFFDNERYLLSALVQSLAATIALVITLSLVAVQLVSQSYSSRVIEVYRKNPDMWILLFIYIITIFYGLGLTKIIGLGILENYVESAIFVAYFMGFFAFISLVPYILDTLASINPLILIQYLSKKITKDTILNYLNKNDHREHKDPVLPIVDILNGALSKNDDETVEDGVFEIKNAIIHILEDNNFGETEEENVSRFIIKHIEMIGIQAIDKSNENSSISVILALNDIRKKAVDCKLEKATHEAVKALENIQLKVLNHKFENATEKLIEIYRNEGIEEFESGLKNIAPASTLVLSHICIETIENKMDIAAATGIGAIKKIGLKAADLDNFLALVWIVGEIENIGIKASKMKNDYVAKTTIKAFREIIEPAFKKERWFALEYVLNAIDNITILASDNKLESTTEAVIKIFATISRWAIDDNYEDMIIKEMLNKLEKLANQSIEEKLESQFMSISIAIQDIGIKAADKKRGTIIQNIIDILKPIRIKAAEQNLMQSEWMAINAFKEIGVKSAENKLEEETETCKRTLEELIQNVDKKDEIREMVVIPYIEEALEEIKKAKLKSRDT